MATKRWVQSLGELDTLSAWEGENIFGIRSEQEGKI